MISRRSFFAAFAGAAASPVSGTHASSNVAPWEPLFVARHIRAGELVRFPDGSTSRALVEYRPGCRLMLEDHAPAYAPPGVDIAQLRARFTDDCQRGELS